MLEAYESGAPTSRAHAALPWSATQIAQALDVDTLALLGDLDPRGLDGFVPRYLRTVLDSLGPALGEIARLRAAHDAAGLVFEVHKLRSPTGQIGALRVAARCADFASSVGPEWSASVIEPLLDALVAEILRLQLDLERLLEAPVVVGQRSIVSGNQT